MAGEANRTRNHDEIRRWVEGRGGHPATVARTERGRDAGILRIDFPGYSGEDSLQPISWDEFFDKFDENNLEFLYQDTAANGEPSRFNKLVSAGSKSGQRSRAETTARRGTSTRRGSSTRKSTSSRRAAPSRKSTSKSKSGSRTTTKRTSARKTTGTSRAGTTRKSTSSRRTSGTRSTRSAGAGSRRTTGTARRSRAKETGTEETPLIIGIVQAEPYPTDEVIRLEDEGPVAGGGMSATETSRTRNRRRGTGLESGSHQGTL